MSVELLDHPEYVGLPSVAALDVPRSVISSASYEARALGIHSAMSLSAAKRICPDVVVLGLNFAKYKEYSQKVMKIFHDFTPVVEPLSIDEAFLDVSGATKLFGSAEQIAHQIRSRVMTETGLPCSVGVAKTKFVAKIASGKAKPRGILVVEPDATLEFLHPLPVESLWGVGRKTAEVLHKRGLHTIGDVAHAPKQSLISALGESTGNHLHELSWGRDNRAVQTDRVEKSIGREHTFNADVTDHEFLTATLLDHADHVGRALRTQGIEARTIGLKVTFSNFEQVTRSRTLIEPTSVSREIHRVVCELLNELPLGGRAVRLIGVRASSLVEAGSAQLSLWEDEADAWGSAERALDEVEKKFGPSSVRPASLLRIENRRIGPTQV